MKKSQKYSLKQLIIFIFLIWILSLIFSNSTFALANLDQQQFISNNRADSINQKPQLQKASSLKANNMIEGNQLNNFFVSEKLDGVRGFWTGKKMITRNGNEISIPTWFTQDWPNEAMDGEIWSNRNQFEQISSCVRSKKNNNSCWSKMKFMIFDLPKYNQTFTHRIKKMQEITQQTQSKYLAVIAQKKFHSMHEVDNYLDEVISQYGEGLMLHHQDALYQEGKVKHLLKLKKYQDAEAVVIKHIPGKGKYSGMLGALLVKLPSGLQFKIGTGFSDLERQSPPSLGSTITFKYYGKTQRGVPRFASFLRIRPPLE